MGQLVAGRAVYTLPDNNAAWPQFGEARACRVHATPGVAHKVQTKVQLWWRVTVQSVKEQWINTLMAHVGAHAQMRNKSIDI
jgi:hypothetical protein